MWDEEDGFFYDVLRLPDGKAQRLKVRSMVGLLPLCAATVFERRLLAKYPELDERLAMVPRTRVPSCRAAIHDPSKPGVAGRRLASDPGRNASSAACWPRCSTKTSSSARIGIRSLSRYHADHPYVIHAGGQEYRVAYLPAESDTGMFGGNSNWRGPIWMPVNALIIRALLQYYGYYGNDFTVECPTGSGRHMNLYQVAEEISRRLASIFLKDKDGRRPVYGGTRSSRTTRTGAISCSSTSTSTATTAPASAPATRPAGPASSPAACTCSRPPRAEQVLELGQAAAIVEAESPWGAGLGTW